jgi:hypothetical protein
MTATFYLGFISREEHSSCQVYGIADRRVEGWPHMPGLSATSPSAAAKIGKYFWDIGNIYARRNAMAVERKAKPLAVPSAQRLLPCGGRRRVTMKNQSRLSLAAAIVSLATGCGYSAPYQTSGPSLSSQGVEVGIAGVSCYVNRSADPFLQGVAPDILGLDLKVEVKNNSGQAAQISEARMRLADPAAPAAEALTPEKSEIVAVSPGETKDIPLSFRTSDVLSCHHGFQLVLADSVELGASPIAFSPISIVASR